MFAWVVASALVGFAVAAIGTQRLRLSREAFVLIHAGATTALLVAYTRARSLSWSRLVRVRPILATIVTLVAASLGIRSVLAQAGAPAPTGARLVFEILWDGVVYGAADGALLTVLPMLAVLQSFGHVHGARRIERTALALLASVAVFAAYHVGFVEFVGPAIVWPIVAALLFGIAYAVCENPLAPILAHAAMHVAAVLHGAAGTVQLPPHYGG
jgi:hypothetical protein